MSGNKTIRNSNNEKNPIKFRAGGWSFVSAQNTPVPAKRVTREQFKQTFTESPMARTGNKSTMIDDEKWKTLDEVGRRDYCAKWISDHLSVFNNKIINDIQENGQEKYIQNCIETVATATSYSAASQEELGDLLGRGKHVSINFLLEVKAHKEGWCINRYCFSIENSRNTQ